MSIYTNLYEITLLQQKIVRYINYWVKVENVPVPQREIIEEMIRRGEKSSTVSHALSGLLRLGYIRKAITNGSGEDGKGSDKTKYVQLKNI